MDNNAVVGFTLQKLICEKYGIIPTSTTAMQQFKSAYDKSLKISLETLIEQIFDSLRSEPEECTTFCKDSSNKTVPYNFVLKDNSTLSIRTNMTGCKVAPRIVGQAGFEKLNEHFASIYGKEIKNQDDIKHLMTEKIDKALPVFFDMLFDADYVLWIYQEGTEYKYHLLRGDSGVNIDYDLKNFTFTRPYDKWAESTTLKYKGTSIAEIQVHKNRSFKFRFIMKGILPLLIAKKETTETIGITAEKVICDLYGLKYPTNFFKRYSVESQYQMETAIKGAFTFLPHPIEHSGSDVGERGGASKCSYDFLLNGNQTLSVKTNIGKMVCPPEVGQPNDKTCYLYFKQFVDDDHIDKMNFKKMVYDHITEMLPIYVEHMFDSDYLLYIYLNDKFVALETGSLFGFRIYEKNVGRSFHWDESKISFSKPTIEEWNESNTLYYDGVSIGEFQVHLHRNCYKFRFNFNNLFKIIKK